MKPEAVVMRVRYNTVIFVKPKKLMVTEKVKKDCRVTGHGRTSTISIVQRVMREERTSESDAVVTIIDRYNTIMSILEKGSFAELFKAASSFKK